MSLGAGNIAQALREGAAQPTTGASGVKMADVQLLPQTTG